MMGKRQKLSRGHSSGFVPDYRHTVNAGGESEGLGSCGRADSEDSCTPKRKCTSLNNARIDRFNVHSEVISFSKMSSLERRELEVRLRAELGRIQMFQKKILRDAIEVVASSSTNKQLKRKHPADVEDAPDEKCGASNLGLKNQRLQSFTATSNLNVMLMKDCGTLLNQLMSHKFAVFFNTPVDVVKWNIPDYFSIIKDPVDLGTVKSKLTSGAYSSPLKFLSDVRLTFTNAMTYNPPGNEVHNLARKLSSYFESKWKPIEKKLSTLPPDSVVTREKGVTKSAQQSKMRKAAPKSAQVVPLTNIDSIKVKMTEEEKQSLSRRLESLLSELPDHIIDFLRKHSSNAANEDEIELDIEALGDDTLFELQALLDKHFKDRTPHVTKVGACEIEALDGFVISNSLNRPCKVQDSPEEDVDIGGNDAPIPIYPPVEIEKDAAIRDNVYSTSSSSGSDSGSSSSDSDSAGSFRSKSQVDKASSPTAINKENLETQTTIQQGKSGILNPFDVKGIPGRSVQQQQNAHFKAPSTTENGHKQGENASSETQLSPEKRYRNAMKINRFADTILKAREKMLDKADKGDPDKLRREREEFERLQREEKTRLQAEARAADEARRQAQAAAAAEARRLREIEREAARQALLKMEKSVEIDESSQFLKDLEMLRCDPVEQLPSSVDETSPDLSQDGFMVRGSNPLEKLGLFMKVDDDEADDAEPNHVKNVEEGEHD